MLSERIAVVRDNMQETVNAGVAVGAVCGGITGLVALLLNVHPGDGFLGSLVSIVPGMTLVIIVAVGVGVAVGGILAVIESPIAYVFAHRAARKFQSLVTFTLVLGCVYASVNATATAVVVSLALGVNGSDAISPLLAGLFTVLTVLMYARVQSTDWPQPRPHHSHHRAEHYTSRVVDLNATELTLRHDRLADLVRDQEIQADG